MSESSSAEIVIAPVGLEHLRQVLDLGYRVFDTSVKPYTSWSLTAVAEHLDSGDSACWVALDGETVVGFVLGSQTFELRDDWGYLEWIAVDPAYQGRGIAGRLVNACCEALFAGGASRVVTDVESSNNASATLMSRNGFAPAVTVTLFVRSSQPDAEPTRNIPGASKRHLIRSGRLVGDHRPAG
ncbi:GNAT family N-acetyltransferase [Catellatospora tritici]|uniref:GNAT family N-acetyltransferase n=1 Tax=Catellatospora tritici TaxID=2851566 RepID=UPI001C2CD1F0|nr:GNAT family N-acetyltransferase [Catellatospora tritici]MBV1848737.1 GNAT family N-acetyltransferase [Catellatospora tritici]